jgi:hypothetical protein
MTCMMILTTRAVTIEYLVAELVTELVFHPEMFALNDDAPSNIRYMSVTELVSHPEMSALNANAPANIYPMSVTELVPHPEMSALNDDAS